MKLLFCTKKILLPFLFLLIPFSIKPNNACLEKKLSQTIFNLSSTMEKENLLQDLDPYVIQCYYMLQQNKNVPLDYLLEVYEMISNRSNGSLRTIFDLTCDIENSLNDIFSTIDNDTKILCEKFDYTWTILEALNSTNSINYTFSIDISSVFTLINEIEKVGCQEFNNTWTILDSLNQCNTQILITQPLIITNAGNYCLAQDIVGTITIAADNVLLDMNNFNIAGSLSSIEVANQSNISIKNGSLSNATNSALSLNSCTNIQLDNLSFTNNNQGLSFLNSAALNIQNCLFKEHSAQALNINTSSIISCQNSTFFNNTSPIIIDLQSASSLSLKNTTICHNSSATPAQLININNTNDLVIESCQVDSNFISTGTILEIANNSNNINILKTTFNSNSSDANDSANLLVSSNATNLTLQDIEASKNTLYNASLITLSFSSASINNIVLENNQAGIRCIDCSDCPYFVLNNCSSSGNNIRDIALSLNACSNASIQNSTFNNNYMELNTDFIVALINNSNNITLSNLALLENYNLGSETLTGISIANSTNIFCRECKTNAHSANNNCTGIATFLNASDITFDNCISCSNNALNGTVNGFASQDSFNIIFNACTANNNTGADNARGFDLVNTPTSSIVYCTALLNQATVNSHGIHADNCFNLIASNNTAVANNALTIGSGISVEATIFSFFLENICNENSTHGLHFVNSWTNSISYNVCNNNADTGIFLDTDNGFNIVNENVANFNNTGIHFGLTTTLSACYQNLVQENSIAGITIDQVTGSGQNTAVLNTNNFNGIRTPLAAVFSLSTNTFIVTRRNIYDNLSVVQ